MTDKLPELIDRKGIQEEMGVSRAYAEAIMRAVPKVELDAPGRTGRPIRKVYVRRADVLAEVERRTRAA